MEQRLEFSEALLKKYDQTGPRYTSYPTAVQFVPALNADVYSNIAQTASQDNPEQPLSLYFHIPFCDTLCYYCGCSKIITRDYSLAIPYIEYIEKEIKLQAPLFGNRLVTQLHLGGGTPTFLDNQQMTSLMQMAKDAFTLDESDQREFSIEIDPRSVDNERIELLANIGFNRLSMGIQDFDPQVQKAVNRIQSKEDTLNVINHAREVGFKSISVDLIYGLPKQQLETFSVTLDSIIGAKPDRVAVYNYAHMPHLFKTQKGIKEVELPNGELKLKLLALTIEKLTNAGYIYIGMDHFSLPEDELSIAQRQGTLHRNFQGYSTQAECDLIGLGLSSIGKVGNSYSQNEKDIESYYSALDKNKLPILRGVELDKDDVMRRHIISELMCHSALTFTEIETMFDINFKEYFKQELLDLETFTEDNLLIISEDGLQITPSGRMLMRNIGMQFDAYLKPGGRKGKKGTYSKLI
ncbi:MAG: oxygen-independent coproporphyrinogen III oxidase [Gammaproteobacteria bacterium]|nr:oxygen-independent coproporphyrinogen III oxidase [Gammaproteobacteria bacterium]